MYYPSRNKQRPEFGKKTSRRVKSINNSESFNAENDLDSKLDLAINFTKEFNAIREGSIYDHREYPMYLGYYFRKAYSQVRQQ